jgi:di/tricarboxylate transporter
MRARTCGRQLDVQRAAASGRWTDELRSHATTCASCREIVLVTSALAGDPTAAPRRVSPSILWAKARFARRRKAETVASNILMGSQAAIAVIGLGAVAYVGARLDAWSAIGASPWGTVLLGGAGLLVAGGLVTLRWIGRRA